MKGLAQGPTASEWRKRYWNCTYPLCLFRMVRVCWVGAGREVEQGPLARGEGGPPQEEEVPAELPKGSSVCRAPNGTGTSKVVGKHLFPSPTKGRVDLFPSRKTPCPE